MGKDRKQSRTKKKEQPNSDEKFTGAMSPREAITRSFPDLVLNPDHANRPIYVAPDGHIFLETFSPYYKKAYDFMIAIAEPISRPKYIQEYQITMYSLYAAYSIGLKTEDILYYLSILSKCELTEEFKKLVSDTVNNIGMLKLILHNNRYFIQSPKLSLLRDVAKAVGPLRVEDPDPLDTVDPDTGFILPDDETTSVDIAGVGNSADYSSTSRMLSGLGGDTNQSTIPTDDQINRRFEVRSNVIQKVRKLILFDLQLPFSDEYDFHNDPSPNLLIDLKTVSAIRPYQEKALNKIFGGGRAKSGIIVLPCGAGKTLVGISAACTIKKSTIVFCDSNVPVDQWRNQFISWTTVDESLIYRFTSGNKTPIPNDKPIILITTYSIFTSAGKNKESEDIIAQICALEWGLMIIDEIQGVVAETFVKVFDMIKAHSKLGLTATLIREDEKIKNLNYLIGPRLYEANWIDLAEQGYIARVQCFEIWNKMTGEFYREYMHCNDMNLRRIYSSLNPNKFQTVERLIRYHEKRGDKILVFADILFVLGIYHDNLKTSKQNPNIHRAMLCGETKNDEREKIFNAFKTSNKYNCIFISRIGDKAIDLPSANVLIQICSHFGSRMQEAQRLGRILRPKTGRADEYNAFFYTLISEDTKEMYFSRKRQQFLVDQGYSFKVVQDPENKWPTDEKLMFSTKEEQRKLLEICRNADADSGSIEKDNDAESSSHAAQLRVRKSGDLTGASASYTMRNR
ncbi:DNA repair helicase rad25 family protein [Histomonas meleagridis]|uniref:DNA repair helicase rad25 family protein n=1 Tax=Histomonas meleagridis TaxID=135588 RepID=UPI00355A1E13|nr:DNA repair helicase rad25 family protein [Histomonas meleagridis]KAH0805780.1 DNA repair helicase rad25 family protein [Histomonas meleagridis]